MQCRGTGRVVRLHEVYDQQHEMVLVLELAAGGELQHILDQGHCLQEVEARKAMKQILEGVAYLHDRNIAHLDLKPQNLLLSVEDSCEDIKLCDFGISKVLQPGVTVREILGTADYVAPEVLSYEPIGLSTDVWSIGVLAYVLLSGFSPFGADDKQQTFLNISRCSLSFEPEHFDDVSTAAVDFIKSALVVNPRDRPSIHEMLDHPWISLKTNLPAQLPSSTTNTSNENGHYQTSSSSSSTLPQPRSTPMTQRKSFSCLPSIESSPGSSSSAMGTVTATASPKPSSSSSAASSSTTFSCSNEGATATAVLQCLLCGPTCRRHHHHHHGVRVGVVAGGKASPAPPIAAAALDRGILC
ncbi:unnamed protein product [Acanthoscelides obtectus]|uniref:Protein kinase domain-containing protein n=1 Tax=Acanthoscelides obtectus TaxID=200917 RepID=A0A9P0PR51_ACAOB|nr:unnamed protein product [Acanthoscelides obtectus]CAK1620813.1 Death-associated protein kinase related [Acanthoscelides obtectus]